MSTRLALPPLLFQVTKKVCNLTVLLFGSLSGHSAKEQALYNSGTQATNEAASSRAMTKTKATKCETDGVLFAKNKRRSFMTESMRSSKIDRHQCENAHEEADAARKASFNKNQ